MFQEFPYTDMHQLNLDWIIKIAKDFLDQYTHIQDLIAAGEQSLQDLTASGLDQLQDKADNLTALLEAWYTTHSTDIANQLAQALADLNSWYTTHQNYLNQTLEDKTTEFNRRADQKTADSIASIPADYTEVADNVAMLIDYLQYIAPEIYTRKLADSSVACVANTMKGFPVWNNPYTILYAGHTYLIKAVLDEPLVSANVHVTQSVGSDVIVHVDGTTPAYGFYEVAADSGWLYVYANGNCNAHIETYEIPRGRSAAFTSAGEEIQAIQFPLLKGHRYEAVIEFGSPVTLSNFSLSGSDTYNWNPNFTPITEVRFYGTKVIRRFRADDDYEFLVYLLEGLSSGVTYTLSAQEIYAAESYGETTIAAYNSPLTEKMCADFQCTGSNDEYILNMAYRFAFWNKTQIVKLANGIFNIQSFPYTLQGIPTAIFLVTGGRANDRDMTFCGSNCSYGFNGSRFGNGTCIYLDATGYGAASSSDPSAIFGTNHALSILSGVAITLKDFGLYVYDSQKPIIAINLKGADRVYCERLALVGYANAMINDPDVGLQYPPTNVPVQGFVGIHMGTGSNDPQGYTFRNIGVWGFYEGFRVGGEHTLMEQCAASIGVYGYTFGNYEYGNNPNTIVHPITMINCCDERNQNFPLFKRSGYGQEITMIGFNLEQVTSKTPGNVFNHYMTVEEGAHVCGEITYTIMTEWSSAETGGNRADVPLWASGSGSTFISHNAVHKMVGSTTERNTYSPNYGQMFYDTTLGKLLTCINPTGPIWADSRGAIV